MQGGDTLHHKTKRGVNSSVPQGVLTLWSKQPTVVSFPRKRESSVPQGLPALFPPGLKSHLGCNLAGIRPVRLCFACPNGRLRRNLTGTVPAGANVQDENILHHERILGLDPASSAG